ncbi:MAG: STAS domain-containing protein [Acetobacteraceae bacterium]|nr:STAS domain-containing protein [Acetobacteraceae bacterium]
MNEHTEASTKTLQLSPILDLGAAGPLAAEFQASRGSELTLVASDVQRISASCLQVLLSAQLTWAVDGMGFRVTEPSTEYSEGVGLLGAESLIPGTTDLEMRS